MDDMMSSIAALGMSMKAEQFAMDYNVAVTKKAMDTQESAAEALIDEMLPQTQMIQVPKGDFIDVYA